MFKLQISRLKKNIKTCFDEKLFGIRVQKDFSFRNLLKKNY